MPDRQKIDKEAIERKLRKKGTYGSNEMRKHLEKLEKENYPTSVKKVIREEIERYEMMPEINDLLFAYKKLEKNHYGLKNVKEKIIEYLAAQQKSNKSLGQVICLVGPPGVGKTSLAASIAEATGRKFISISVGGIRDVAEIQGHRRTYIGAMPGRIIQAMKKAQVINPCFLIDEIDKFSSDYRGDPAYALLEVLDPNQNKNFTDNYLGEEVPYNLSEVMFICTANDEHELPLPLLDRMEIVRLSSYTEIEKFHIAKEYLIPESLKKHNLNSGEIVFEDQTIRDIIKYYTRESGVRELNRKIQTIVRKFIVQLLQDQKDKVVVTPSILVDYLKKKDYEFTSKQKKVVHYPRKEGEFESTGNLGDIMKESARVALNYIKANHEKFGINSEIFSQNSIHIHAPEGATPKEGPSAGIALTSAIISALTGRIIPRDIGMTGEITLHGHVEAIGGLKEKAIAACRSDLKTIIIPKANEKNIEDIPEEVRRELKIITVEEYEEV
ncbi:16090_t:CDS:2 [Entrophospora sp. SA101]|nr:16090_t:CDS:2 [Entrophospora sp. SA101]